MKEHLVGALTKRKQQVLPAALQIFNKLQEKSYSTKRFNEFKKIEKIEEVSQIDQNLLDLQYVLDNPRSPIISSIVEAEKYHDRIPSDVEEYYSKPEDYEEPIDLEYLK